MKMHLYHLKFKIPELKKEDFAKGLNSIITEEQPDLLIYTGTMTAGVSIDVDYFDHFIGCLFSHTTDVLSFIQSLHRVRHVKSKTIEIYYHNVRNYLPTTMADLNSVLKLEQYKFNSLTTHIELYLSVRSNSMKVYSGEILLDGLHRMGYNVSFEESIGYDCPIDKTTFDSIKIEVNPRRQVKKLIEEYIEGKRNHMIKISEDYFTILTHDIQFDTFLEEGGNDNVYIDQWYIQLCQYAGFKKEVICKDSFHTTKHAKQLLHVIANLKLYKNYFYRGDLTAEKIREFVESEELNTELASKNMIPRDMPKVVNKIDAMHRNEKAKEIIMKVQLNKEYSAEEFEVITNEWLKEVRKDYPEMKFNHTTIKVLNEFCSRSGKRWESKRKGTGDGKYRVYKLVDLNL